MSKSLKRVLVATALAPVAATLSVQDVGIPYCAWNPLSRLEEEGGRFCEADWLETLLNAPQQQENATVAVSNLGWQGPHGCIDEYCIYSNPSRSEGRGMVVITSEANLKILDAMPQAPSIDNAGSSYRVDGILGKGLGLIAMRELKRGEVVMQHAPSFLAHRNIVERRGSLEKNRLLDLAATYLPSPTRERFLDQVGHKGGHLITDILTTNSFQVNFGGDNGEHFGTYNEVSRFNHACRPNVVFYIDANLTHRSAVIRPIRPREELTISYLNPLELHDERQDRTKIAWGFQCECSHCRNVGRESDKRVKRIRDLEAKLEDVETRVTMGMVRRSLELYQDERLDVKMAGPLTVAAYRSNLLGEEEAARQYALQAIESGLLEGGETGDVMAMRELLADPRAHFTWAKQARKKST